MLLAGCLGFLSELRDFSYPIMSRLALAYPAFYSVGTGGPSSRGIRVTTHST